MVIFVPNTTTNNNNNRSRHVRGRTTTTGVGTTLSRRKNPLARFAPSTTSNNNNNNNATLDYQVEINEIESIPQEMYAQYHYSEEELLESRRKEIASIQAFITQMGKQAQACHDINKAEIEIETSTEEELTWRGIEDYRYGRDKTKHCKLHAMRVLKECRRQQRAGMIPNAHLLKQISQTSSLEATRIALERAEKDAKEQGHCSKKNTKTTSTLSSSSSSSVMRSSTGSLPSSSSTTSTSRRHLSPAKTAVSRSLVAERPKSSGKTRQRTLSPLPNQRPRRTFCQPAFLNY